MNDRTNSERNHRVWLAQQGIYVDGPSEADLIRLDLVEAQRVGGLWQARIAVCQQAVDHLEQGIIARA